MLISCVVDPATCAKNCALDGADYEGTYGITTSGDSLTLSFVTGSNVGSRVYLLGPLSEVSVESARRQDYKLPLQ
jgi:cellulose 1,4-beta-cellobiosidase